METVKQYNDQMLKQTVERHVGGGLVFFMHLAWLFAWMLLLIWLRPRLIVSGLILIVVGFLVHRAGIRLASRVRKDIEREYREHRVDPDLHLGSELMSSVRRS